MERMQELRELYIRTQKFQDYVSTTGLYGERSLFTAIQDGKGGHIELYFDFISKTAKDQFGIEYEFVKQPCEAWFKEFDDICKKLEPPKFFMDSQGKIRLRDHPEIVFDVANMYWENETNNVHIVGLGCPITIIE